MSRNHDGLRCVGRWTLPGRRWRFCRAVAGVACLSFGLAAAQGVAEESRPDHCEGTGEGAYRVLELQRADASLSLVLFGTRHRTDPADPVWVELERLVAKALPIMVLVEGDSPVQATREAAIARGGEPGFLCWLAAQRGAACQSLDLPEPEEARRLLERHSPDEVLLFLTVRVLAYYNARGATERPPGDVVLRALRRYGPMVGLPDASSADLDRTCKRTLHRSWDPGAVSVEWHDPRQRELLTQRISRESNELREPYMLEKLLESSRGGARVFAAVGEGHVCNLQAVLRARWRDAAGGGSSAASPTSAGSGPETRR